MGLLGEERRAALLAYCKLTELAEDPEAALIDTLYAAAVAYLAQAGVAEPPEGTPRRAQYDLCVNALVLDGWDKREITAASFAGDNPVFRRTVAQLKLTENVSDSDTSGG